MQFSVTIKRQKDSGSLPYVETHLVEAEGTDSVATLLEKLNETLDEEIGWECSCLQKKCGACAMVINGRPRLACNTFLKDLKKGKVRLEPLSKFPVIRDLIVDRSVMFEQLKRMNVWLEQEAQKSGKTAEIHFQSAGCLMCGCCLEICPNFAFDRPFAGAIAAVNGYRAIDDETDPARRKELEDRYAKMFFNVCGKSLSCNDICPVGLPVEELIVRSNAAAVWRKKNR